MPLLSRTRAPKNCILDVTRRTSWCFADSWTLILLRLVKTSLMSRNRSQRTSPRHGRKLGIQSLLCCWTVVRLWKDPSSQPNEEATTQPMEHSFCVTTIVIQKLTRKSSPLTEHPRVWFSQCILARLKQTLLITSCCSTHCSKWVITVWVFYGTQHTSETVRCLWRVGIRCHIWLHWFYSAIPPSHSLAQACFRAVARWYSVKMARDIFAKYQWPCSVIFAPNLLRLFW